MLGVEAPRTTTVIVRGKLSRDEQGESQRRLVRRGRGEEREKERTLLLSAVPSLSPYDPYSAQGKVNPRVYVKWK